MSSDGASSDKQSRPELDLKADYNGTARTLALQGHGGGAGGGESGYRNNDQFIATHPDALMHDMMEWASPATADDVDPAHADGAKACTAEAEAEATEVAEEAEEAAEGAEEAEEQEEWEDEEEGEGDEEEIAEEEIEDQCFQQRVSGAPLLIPLSDDNISSWRRSPCSAKGLDLGALSAEGAEDQGFQKRISGPPVGLWQIFSLAPVSCDGPAAGRSPLKQHPESHTFRCGRHSH